MQMGRWHRYLWVLTVVAAAALSGPADCAEPAAVLERMIDAAGGRQAFHELGFLQSVVKEEETLRGGEQTTRTVTTLVRTDGLSGMHLQLTPEVALYCNTEDAWAFQNGELDTRPLVPKMARGTIHQRVVPMLAPFSLELPGVQILSVDEEEWEQQPVWRVGARVLKDFFANPVLNTDWTLFVRRSDARLLAMEVYPPKQFRDGTDEGMRYRISSVTEVEGVSLPSRLLIEGLDFDGVETGHFMIVQIEHRLLDTIDPILFVNPADIEALDESDFPDL